MPKEIAHSFQPGHFVLYMLICLDNTYHFLQLEQYQFSVSSNWHKGVLQIKHLIL